MSGLDVDMEEKNAVGGIDRLVTNVALAAVAVFPTLMTAVATPWKLVPQLGSDEPDGKRGILLSPGAFLALGTTVVLLCAAAIATSETVASNTGAIGPGLALAVANAASEGNVPKTISLIAPIYILAISIGVLAQLLRRCVGAWWTLRISMRAAFYQIGVTVCWIILSSAAIDAIRVSTGSNEIGSLLYSLNSLPIFGLSAWMYFWFFRRGGEMQYWRALTLSAAMLVITLGFVASAGWLLSKTG